MLDTLLPYFERELSSLRELSGEFARRYPKIAGRLLIEGDQCEDPHVERLIESFAFLAARVHKKLDDEYPEIAASLLDLVYPHYQQPVPSASIVQFESDEERLAITRRQRIERHQLVQAPPINAVHCSFRSVYPVDMLPITLTGARIERVTGGSHNHRRSPDAAALLTLELNTHGALPLTNIDLCSLRFFLDGEPALMYLLQELLLTKVLRVEVSNGSEDPQHTHRLPAATIAAVGFGEDEGMLDYDSRSFLGYRLLTEYFCYPEKFLFIDFQKLGPTVARLPGSRLVLRCVFSHYPDTERHHRLLTQLQPGNLKLGCTPIINLFSQAGKPVLVSHLQTGYSIEVDGRKGERFEVIQIQRVTRVEKTGLHEHTEEVPPFYALRHGTHRTPPRYYWHATRHESNRADDPGTDVELNLVELDFTPLRESLEALSLQLLCSNRDLPEHIPFGGALTADRSDFSMPGHSVVKRVRLLRKPTPTQRFPLKRGMQWRLISHLSLNYLSITQGGRDALLEILALYNRNDAPSNTRQIQGIHHIDSQAGVTRVAGKDFSGFVRGTDIRLTLDEDAYVGGSLYLFASILERFFALYCAPNSFTRLTVTTLQRPEEQLTWPARTGAALVI